MKENLQYRKFRVGIQSFEQWPICYEIYSDNFTRAFEPCNTLFTF